MRSLVALCDTEGVPFRKTSNTDLWNLCMYVTCVVDVSNGKFSVPEKDLFHILHFTKNKHDDDKETKQLLQCHNHCLDVLYERYNIDGGMYALCWNAPHDRNVFKYYLDKYNKADLNRNQIEFIDVLPWARKRVKTKQSMKLGDVYQKFVKNPTVGGKKHTALTDVLMMEQIINEFGDIGEIVEETKIRCPDEYSKSTTKSSKTPSKECTSGSLTKPTSDCGTSTSSLMALMICIQALFYMERSSSPPSSQTNRR